MKKIIKITLLSIMIMFALCITSYAQKNIYDTPENIGANDFSSVMQEETKKYIESNNEILMDRTDSKIIFVTVPTTNGQDIDIYAENLYNAWNVKNIGDSSSTFILFSTEDMDYWAIVGDHLRSALNEETINTYLLQYTEPDFAKKDFDAAINKTYDAIALWYSANYNISPLSSSDALSEKNGEDQNQNEGGFISVKIIIPILIILIIIVMIVKRKIKLYQISQKKRQRIMSYKKQLRKELEMKYK